MTACGLAREIYAEVVNQVAADRLVETAVRRIDSQLFIQDQALNLEHYERVFVCGAGKAAGWMAQALVGILGPWVKGGLVVVPPSWNGRIPGVDAVPGSHPIPSSASVVAGEKMLGFAADTSPGDLVIFCLSGGASAMMESPVFGVSLEELRDVTRLLLGNGSDIRTINAVRGRLSRIKGGALATAFQASVVCLVVSDVIGDDGRAVASGPFSPRIRFGSQARSVAILNRDLPAHISSALLETDAPPDRNIPHHVIGSAALLWPLTRDAALRHGLTPVGFADPIVGDASAEADRVVGVALARRRRGESEFCLVFCGETTVTLRKSGGKGGRCQEMATRALRALQFEANVAFLAAGTDGHDGNSSAAGACVDAEAMVRARRANLSPDSALVRNDTFPFLSEVGCVIPSMETRTNVNDLILVVHKSG